MTCRFIYREAFEFAKCFAAICPLVPILSQISPARGYIRSCWRFSDSSSKKSPSLTRICSSRQNTTVFHHECRIQFQRSHRAETQMRTVISSVLSASPSSIPCQLLFSDHSTLSSPDFNQKEDDCQCEDHIFPMLFLYEHASLPKKACETSYIINRRQQNTNSHQLSISLLPHSPP